MTELLFLKDSYQKTCSAKVFRMDNERLAILDETILYPQGGGQPCDLGKLVRGNEVFSVLSVKKNGLDVVETMQALGCKSVYVMVSADVESSTKLRAINLKLFEFMRKPVAPEDLLETIERAMAHSQLLAA